jgi:PAS domain S-box-containing protein
MNQTPAKPAPQALTLLEQMREGCVTFDSLWRFTYVNAEAEALLQRSRDELLNRSLVSLFPEVASTPIYKQFCTTLEQESPIAFTAFYPPLDKWFEIRAHPYGTGLAVSFRDITEIRAAEAALRQALRQAEEARDRTTAILRSVTDALIVTDNQGRILLMNRVAEQLTASACTAVTGAPLDAILADDALRRELAQARRQAGSESGFEVEFSPGNRPSERLVLQGRVAPILDSCGTQLGHISLLRDITRERQVDRLKSEFISTAAHELRTPLTSILGFTEILRNLADEGNFDPAQEREFLDIILDKAETLAHLIDELLDLGRIESGRSLQLELQPCDLGELLTRIARQHAEMDQQRSYCLDLPASPQRLSADPRKLTQILDNLLGNAAKYSPPGSRIQMKARSESDSCTIEVVDAGIGLAPEHLEVVFEKFYRVDASNTAREGLGLGLTIARNLAQAHGGQLWLESSPGQGTRAILQLPCQAPSPFGE